MGKSGKNLHKNNDWNTEKLPIIYCDVRFSSVGADVIVTISLYIAKKLNKYISKVQLCAKVYTLMKLSGKLRQESSF